jgi:hypothetical protein
MFTAATLTADTSARHRRDVAVTTVLGLIVAGLVTVPGGASEQAAAAELGVPETFLVSQTDAAASVQPFLTPDGQRVAFASTAPDLIAGDANEVSDVFLATAAQGSDDPFTAAPVLVSTPDSALPQEPANGQSSLPTASADGRYVAFLSTATNLAAGSYGVDAWTNVYVRDTVLGTTIRLDVADEEPLGNASSVDISDDGRYVAFVSTAPNLTPGDANAAPDGFIADLDADSDGERGDIAITRVLGALSLSGGVTELVISGNGAHIAFTAKSPLTASDPAGSTAYVYRASLVDPDEAPRLLAANAHSPAINGSGEVVVYIAAAACSGNDTIIASTHDLSDTYFVALATNLVEFRSGGTIADPTVSADGNVVAWETTRPRFSFAGIAPVLSEPVVRTAIPGWSSATTNGRCAHNTAGDYVDLASGTAPSLSASARTVAFSGPSSLAPAASAAVIAIDTNAHAGVTVTSSLGELVNAGYMAVVDIAQIPVSELQGYAAALADAPIYRLPIYRLPIYRLPIYRLPIYRLLIEDSPIYRLPIYRLPIYRLDIPGGWPELLADTPYAGELLQSVTLSELLVWAAEVLAEGSTATDAERTAAARIQSLTLSDVDLSDSGIDSLSLASIILGSALLAQISIPGVGTPLERWQGVVDAQGLDVVVDEQSVLADLDAAGLDIGTSGIEAAVLSALPIESTLMDALPMTRLFLTDTALGALDVATLSASARGALFATEVTGTLEANVGALRPEATVADLAAGTPPEVTFGTLLFSILDAATYPWEQIAPSSIDPNASLRDAPGYACDGSKRCGTNAQFSFTFDPGPGEPTDFAAPTASISLPAGTAPSDDYQASASGPSVNWARSPYSGPIQVDGNLVRMPLPDTAGGTSIEFEVWYTSSSQPGESFADGTLTTGTLSATERLYSFFEMETLDDPTNNRVGAAWDDPARPREALQEGRIYYEWISPEYVALDDEGNRIEGPALDEDYFLVDPPAPGQRLVISTNATDGQIALALFSPSAAQAPLGVEGAGPVPGTAVTEQSGDVSAPAEAGGDAAAPLVNHNLVDQAVVGGSGIAEVQAASTDVAVGEQMLLRVTSGNGRASSSLYSLRARYIDEPAEQVCTPWAAPQSADPGVVGTSDAVTATTNTVYVFDTRRFGDIHGAAAADQVRAALGTLTGTGHVGGAAVDGAVLSVDADASVQAARVALDANPCSMAARRALTGAINTYVSAQLGDERSHITSIVMVGGDDVVPLAPVAQHTAQFNEASHAASLRLSTAPGGAPCPEEVDDGELDACATPLSAAASTNYILTDDPYGLADAYESLGGYLYVPTVAVGRLVETPAQITAAVDRFIAADGTLAADSSISGGYGAWAELPALVTENLSWRSSQNTVLTEPWTRSDVESALFPSAGLSPRVVSINTHADESRMLPGIPGAADGRFADADLLVAAGHADAAQLAGALVFMIGCHAGGNLPTSYYGDVADWADVFGAAGGYIGNTGFGLANNVTTALSERLLGEYSDWVGTEVDGAAVSAAGALTYAKQSYLGGLGLYSGYDEKVLMQSVYYGLPMYAFSGELKSAPLPQRPVGLTPVEEVGNGLSTASLRLEPTFETKTATDASGQDVSYLVADGQEPLTVAGQPVLPRVVSRLDAAPEGMTPRGAFITGLTSERSGIVAPAVTQPSVGVLEASTARAGVAFPSTFATITSQQTPSGPIDLLVVTPGRVEIPVAGSGILERFTSTDLDVIYGPVTQPDGSPTETTAPLIQAVEVPTANGSFFRVLADGTGSGIGRMLLLAQPEGSSEWYTYPMSPSPQQGDTAWQVDTGLNVPMRWIVQVADTAGNVATESARGHLDPAGRGAPTIDGAAGPIALTVGDRLVQSFTVGESEPGERLTASFSVREDNAQANEMAGGPVVVETGDDGVTRALLDHVVGVPGAFSVVVTVCRDRECAESVFPLTVAVANTAPAASVTLSVDTAEVWPSSTLTATAEGSDPEDDPVGLTYRWYVNGGGVPGVDGSTFTLDGFASAGDVVEVRVTPNDGRTDGHVAHADVLVLTEPPPPVSPSIVAVARVGDMVYVEGSWSTAPVMVSFTCLPGDAEIVRCSSPYTVSADTTSDGIEVSGTARDALGNTATDSVVVLYDGTAPELAPVVTPDPVALGAAATAEANATDAASGVESQSCDVPDTSAPGPFSVECRASDVAGNSAVELARYTVSTPAPPSTCLGLPDRTELAPLNADGTSVYKRRDSVPVTFRACDYLGNPITTAGFVTGVTLVSTVALRQNPKVNETSAAPTGAFAYSTRRQAWVGTIPALDVKNRLYTYRIDLADGTSFTVSFAVS